jgi:hypothetical protein
MGKNASKKTEQITRVCTGCGETITQNDIWYPIVDISTCGGGVLYLHARCMVERIFSETKKELLARIAQSEKESDDPLSDGLMNLYWMFPISPIHWVKFYALDEDEKEIWKLVGEDKKEARKRESSDKIKTK